MVVLLAGICSALPLQSAPATINPLIRINQIGYLPTGNKVAVIADPQEGFNADQSFTPGTVYQVRRWTDDGIVYEGTPTAWNDGAIHAQSGDRGWWFDFSPVRGPGDYYIWDVERQAGSYGFTIGYTVYDAVLKTAVRTYFYQRLGFAKEAAFAGDDWSDGAAFIGPGQDTEARSVYDQDNPATARDLRGGWMDAGDYNKYVTFAESVVHELLNAYQERPSAFGDDYNIPESNNGIPDLLDEVHFEMQWLSRMQEEDGGVLLKMGEIDYNGTTPPSSDKRPRFYVPACSSSTIAAAGMYAHAAMVFGEFEDWQDFAAQLEEQALLAWQWYHDNPKSSDCDEGIVKSGDADRSLQDQEKSALMTAIYLHQLTGETTFRDYILSNYLNPQLELNGWSGRWVYQSHYYAALQHYLAYEEAPPAVAAAVLTKMLNNEGDAFFSWTSQDLYRAYMPDGQYHWGSNNVKANIGNANWQYLALGLDQADLAEHRLRAENLLHYFFGVNPLGLVYLSNMETFGAEKSVSQFYHSWFRDGSIWDLNPAPGYVTGGANKNYSGNYPGLASGPVQKAYAEFNGGYSNSWEITENAIYYQSAFIKLLSKFTSPQWPPLDLQDPDGDGIVNSLEEWLGTESSKQNSLMERIRIEPSATNWRLIFTRSTDAEPGRVGFEESVDLSTWTPLFVEEALLLEASDELSTFSLPLQTSLEDAPFLRLVVQ